MKYWLILERSSSTRALLDYEIIIGYCRLTNLWDILCRTDLQEKRGSSPFPYCPKLGKCKHCLRSNKKGRIISFSTKRKYKTYKKVTCRSQNLVYCIECDLCGIQYVGQTRNQLRIRMNNHISTIRTKSDTPLARHLNKIHNVNENPKLTVTVLHLSNSSTTDTSLREKWENIWIARLNTISPKGLNIQD